MPKEQVYKDPILQFFEFDALHHDLQKIAKPFYEVAHNVCRTLPFNQERVKCLDKLLSAKNAAIRTKLYKVEVGEFNE